MAFIILILLIIIVTYLRESMLYRYPIWLECYDSTQ